MGFLPDPLHPAIVHFPIALSLVALLFDFVSRHPRARALEAAGAALMVLAAVAGVVARLSGGAAEEEAVVPQAAKALLDRHEELGEWLMWVLLGVALVRVVLALRGRFRGLLAWGYLVLAAGVAGVVGYQGYIGGELVFRHGLGTAPVQRQLSQQSGQ